MAIFIDNVLGLVVLTLACLLKLSIALSVPQPGNYGIELFQLVKFSFFLDIVFHFLPYCSITQKNNSDLPLILRVILCTGWILLDDKTCENH
jgi:hypothetical protein